MSDKLIEPFEVWKDIEELDGKYQISSYGRIRSTNKIIKATLTNKGYYSARIWISKTKERKHFVIHRQVAKYFVFNDNPIEKNEVNHINGIKTDNRYINLEWISRKEHYRHTYELFGKSHCRPINQARGEKINTCKLKESQVIEIRELLKTEKMINISKKYGVTRFCINGIKLGKTWKYLL